jgi:hypothetical protein
MFGNKKQIDMKEEELEIEIPGDEDENVGDEAPKKKREKKRKTKEERLADRKVIFWTLLIIILVTFLFWFIPKIKEISLNGLEINLDSPNINIPKQEIKNYVEYKL